jgi:RimJ/RimL family protein N-acetyltransferase
MLRRLLDKLTRGRAGESPVPSAELVLEPAEERGARVGAADGVSSAITLRPAEERDVVYFLRLYREEVEAGHFSGWPTPAHAIYFAMAVKMDLVPQHRWPLVRDPNPRKNKTLKTDLFIAEAGGERVGCIAISEPEPGSYAKAAEIWVVITDPEHRHKGVGGQMLDLAIDRLVAESPNRKIVSRCLPASQAMVRLLQRRGFKVISRTARGRWQLEFRPSATA